MFYEKVEESAEYIRGKTSAVLSTGIILGSGLGNLTEIMKDKTVIPYGEIPNFPVSHVAGHAGNFVIGRIGQTTAAVMQGRFHFYEGYGMKEVAYPVYVLKLLGVKDLIVTNACGGINRAFVPGDFMILTDYINLSGKNPLIGENDERFGVRFPDMSQAYSQRLIQKAENTAKKLHISYKKGVYALFPGPCYETAAEIRALDRLGADATGMSTVPETIAANYLGMEVLGIGCITNMATGIAREKHTHEEVVRIAEESSRKLCEWIKQMIVDHEAEQMIPDLPDHAEGKGQVAPQI